MDIVQLKNTEVLVLINEENEIQDVEFTEARENREIRGSVLYYSTSQVAQMLDIPDSTVRYYTKVFDPILNIEVYNKQRKYKQTDIDKLKFIVELKNEGMSVKQILEYCSKVDFNTENGIQIKESNPLSIQTLAKALLEEQRKEFIELKQDLFNHIDEKLKNISNEQITHQNKIKESLLEEVSITVDDVLSDKLNSLQDSIEEIKQEVKIAHVSMESIKEFENPKTFLSKITNLFSKR